MALDYRDTLSQKMADAMADLLTIGRASFFGLNFELVLVGVDKPNPIQRISYLDDDGNMVVMYQADKKD